MQLTDAQRLVLLARFPGEHPRSLLRREVVEILMKAGGPLPAKDLAATLRVDTGTLRALAGNWCDLVPSGGRYWLGVGLQTALGIKPPDPSMRKRSTAELVLLLASCKNARLVCP